MTEIIPYFAGLITILFGVGFALGIVHSNKKYSNNKTKSD